MIEPKNAQLLNLAAVATTSQVAPTKLRDDPLLLIFGLALL